MSGDGNEVELDLVIYVCGSKEVAKRLFMECADKHGDSTASLLEVRSKSLGQRFRYITENSPSLAEGCAATIYFHSSSKVRQWIDRKAACEASLKFK